MAHPVPDTVATIACDDCAGSRVIVTERVVAPPFVPVYGHGTPPALRVTILAGCEWCEGSCMLTTV